MQCGRRDYQSERHINFSTRDISIPICAIDPKQKMCSIFLGEGKNNLACFGFHVKEDHLLRNHLIYFVCDIQGSMHFPIEKALYLDHRPETLCMILPGK